MKYDSKTEGPGLDYFEARFFGLGAITNIDLLNLRWSRNNGGYCRRKEKGVKKKIVGYIR